MKRVKRFVFWGVLAMTTLCGVAAVEAEPVVASAGPGAGQTSIVAGGGGGGYYGSYYGRRRFRRFRRFRYYDDCY
jgi:hypothetical protein